MICNKPITKFEPLVSVVMPCYNHEAYVISSLDSVAASDYESIELIFIDDSSTDDSFNLATKWVEENRGRFSRVICFRHEINRGICSTLNELLSLAQGEFVNPLASDDQLLPKGLSTLVTCALERQVDFVFSDYRLIDEEGNLVSESAFRFYGKDSAKLHRSKWCHLADVILSWTPPWNKYFIRAAMLRRIGLFDETLKFEDRDFIVRVINDGSFALITESTTNYRVILSRRLTPGLLFSEMKADFRRADCRNYLKARGFVRLILGMSVYSYPEWYGEVGAHFPRPTWFIVKSFDGLRRIVTRIHRRLVKL